MKNKYCLIFLILTFVSAAFAQENNSKVPSENNGWLVLLNNPKLSEKWGYTMEAQIRRSDFFLNPEQMLFRTGVDYYINSSTSVTAGYAFISTWPYGKLSKADVNNEQRLWQQVMMNSNTGKLFFNHRYRLEQRWVEKYMMKKDGLPVPDGHNYLNRFCYRLLMQIPLNKHTMEENTVFLAVSNEAFVNFGNSKSNVFEQNRAYLGFGYRFSPNSSIQLGYLNQALLKDDGKMMANHHIIQLLLAYNLLRNS